MLKIFNLMCVSPGHHLLTTAIHNIAAGQPVRHDVAAAKGRRQRVAPIPLPPDDSSISSMSMGHSVPGKSVDGVSHPRDIEAMSATELEAIGLFGPAAAF